jgi:predicted MFS family arabinose efflux permease
MARDEARQGKNGAIPQRTPAHRPGKNSGPSGPSGETPSLMETRPFVLGRVFRAFRHRDFRLMWIGACTSTVGTFVQQFAQSWLVYDLTKDPFYLGLDLFLGQLPIMLFSLFGGVFADRMDRRKMLLVSQYIQMLCAFLLAFLFFTHTVKIWHILTLSFVVGLGQSFGGPAYSALLPALVGAEDLSNAIAMNSIQFNLARVLGPAIGGLAYTSFGPTWCFMLNGFSFIAVIVSLFMIRVKFVPPNSYESILKSLREGIRFVRNRDGMQPLVVLAFCTTLFGFSLTGFLPVFVQNIFRSGPQTYTLLLVFSGAGSICGGLIVAVMEKQNQPGRIALLILIVLGTATAAFAYSRLLPLSCVLAFVGGASIMASASLMLTLVQLIVHDQMRGRVMSVYNLAFRAGMPLGSLSLGKLMPIFGVSSTMACAGLMLVGVALYFLFIERRVATLRPRLT